MCANPDDTGVYTFRTCRVRRADFLPGARGQKPRRLMVGRPRWYNLVLHRAGASCVGKGYGRVTNQIYVTLESLRVGRDGVPVDGFVDALKGVQDAVRLMVEHLAGEDRRMGRRPAWVREQSALRLVTTRPGSVVAVLELESPDSSLSRIESYGPQALEALLDWDGSERSTLPKRVVERLNRAGPALPNEARLWLGDSEIPRRVEIMRAARPRRYARSDDEALLYGWLKMVNWGNGTAQLQMRNAGHVRLRFDESLGDRMRRLATQYVEVRGHGRFDDSDRWQFVRVEKIKGTRSWREPFDLDALWNDPEPRTFDPEEVVTASEPFDVDEFNRVIREGRDVRREGYSQ